MKDTDLNDPEFLEFLRRESEEFRTHNFTMPEIKVPDYQLTAQEKSTIVGKKNWRSMNVDAGFSLIAHRESYCVKLDIDKKIEKEAKILKVESKLGYMDKCRKETSDMALFLAWLRNPNNRRKTESMIRSEWMQRYAYGQGWGDISEKAKQLAGYRCSICGRTHKLNTHHKLLAYAQLLYHLSLCKNQEEREALCNADAKDKPWNVQTNLIVLCYDCHAYVHDHMNGKQLPWTNSQKARLDGLRHLESYSKKLQDENKAEGFERKRINRANVQKISKVEFQKNYENRYK